MADPFVAIIIGLVLLAIVSYVIQNFIEIDQKLKNIILLVVVLVFLLYAVTRLGFI